MKKIMIVFGTRPEAIKMCPLVLEMKKRSVKTILCITGQHKEMLKPILETFSLIPDYDFSIMTKNQTITDITVKILKRIESVLKKEKPDLTLVHGDTSTAFSCALACFYQKLPLAHVEAGLRTYNIFSPYPEEFNRHAISLISQYDFVPTDLARKNLLREGKDKNFVFTTGNTVIDALKMTVKHDFVHPEWEWASDSRLIIMTIHRRENIGAQMKNIFCAARKILDDFEDVKILYPIHMNPLIQRIADKELQTCSRMHRIEPLNVTDFHNFLARCYLVLTDSGGIQEEAAALGKPVLVARNTTERPEGVKSGSLKLIGTETSDVYAACKSLLTDPVVYNAMSNAPNPFGDGHACERIANKICMILQNKQCR